MNEVENAVSQMLTTSWWQTSAWKGFVFSILILFVGLAVTIGLYRILKSILQQVVEKIEAKDGKKQSLLVYKTFVLHRKELFFDSLSWIRRFGIFWVVALSLTFFIESLVLGLEDATNTNNVFIGSLESANRNIKSFLKITPKIFGFLFLITWIARFADDATHLILNRYLKQSAGQRSEARNNTLHVVIKYVINIVAFLFASFLVLDTLGIDIAPLIATAGVASIAIGFGAQSLVKDVLAGFFIILEDQFAVGDYVIIEDIEGHVEGMTLRVTRVRAFDGSLSVIPNGELRSVTNFTSGFSSCDYQVGIAYGSDFDNALKIFTNELNLIHKEYGDTVIAPPQIFGVEELGDSAVTLRAIVKTVPHKQFDTKRLINLRILKRFQKEGINIPFPQRDLWIKNATTSQGELQTVS